MGVLALEQAVTRIKQMQALKLPDGLYLRPKVPSDEPFLQALYISTRDDLLLIDQCQDEYQQLVEMQYQAQCAGYGEQFPNALYFIIEHHHQPVGKVSIDFGANDIRIVDLALVREARGKNLGKGVIQSLQFAATQAGAPLSLTVEQQNLFARRLYHSLGFIVESEQQPYALMVWYPPSNRVVVGV